MVSISPHMGMFRSFLPCVCECVSTWQRWSEPRTNPTSQRRQYGAQTRHLPALSLDMGDIISLVWQVSSVCQATPPPPRMPGTTLYTVRRLPVSHLGL